MSFVNNISKPANNQIIDNLENEFEDTWGDSNEEVKETKEITETKEDRRFSTGSLKNSNNESVSQDNQESKYVQTPKEEILDRLKKQNFALEGIDSLTLIDKWEDLFHIQNINKNTSYINNLIKSFKHYGFDTPKPIQCVTTGTIAMGKDLIAQAKAGNGKTGAFVIGAALRIDPRLHKTQVLILSNTRELADQTYAVVRHLTKFTGITSHLYRGDLASPYDKKTPHIIVGCPGKVKDMINRKVINITNLKVLILDEVDALFKIVNFQQRSKYKNKFAQKEQEIPHAMQIIEQINDITQICCFSATYPPIIYENCASITKDPVYVTLPEDQIITDLVSQWYVKCDTIDHKNGCVLDIIKANPNEFVIIFFNTINKLNEISHLLENEKIKHLCSHSELSNEDRVFAQSEFFGGKDKYKVLLASDLIARGIDNQNVTLVINYDVPDDKDKYVHRIGRAGRGGKLGNSVTLVMTDKDYDNINSIVQIHGIPIKVLKSIEFKN